MGSLPSKVLGIEVGFGNSEGSDKEMGSGNSEGYLGTRWGAVFCFKSSDIGVGKSKANVFVHGYEPTIKAHDDLINILSLKGGKACEDCDLILAFCLMKSRLEADINATIKSIQDKEKPVILVVLHRSNHSDSITEINYDFIQRKNVNTVDCLIHEDVGLLKCSQNSKALNDIQKYLGGNLQPKGVSGRTSAPRPPPAQPEFKPDWRKLKWEENNKVIKSLREFRPCKKKIPSLRFLLHGPVGAGKSSIINSICSVFKEDILPSKQQAGRTASYKTWTVKDKENNILSFVFVDIMGLESENTPGVLTADIISALKGHIKDGYNFNPLSPLSSDDDRWFRKSPDDIVHCLVSVIRADSTLTQDSAFRETISKMMEIRSVVSRLGIRQIVFMTHVDLCCPLVEKDLKQIYKSKKIKEAMQCCSDSLDVPMNCIFPVKNYHEESEVNETIDCLILDALNHAVRFADDYVGELNISD